MIERPGKGIFNMTPEQWRKWCENAPEDPEGCTACGAMAGCCPKYPNCPGNPAWSQHTCIGRTRPARLSATLPKGSKLFDFDDIPVAIVPMPDGGSDCLAFDVSPPRRFDESSLMRNGVSCSAAEFDKLVERYYHEQHDEFLAAPRRGLTDSGEAK